MIDCVNCVYAGECRRQDTEFTSGCTAGVELVSSKPIVEPEKKSRRVALMTAGAAVVIAAASVAMMPFGME